MRKLAVNLKQTERRKDIFTILIIILILVVIGALPTWPHSRSWGYYPSQPADPDWSS
jgi:Protein of unknown function (DUF3309)